MFPIYIHAILLILSVASAFILSLVIPAELELQFVALVFAVYFIFKKLSSSLLKGAFIDSIDSIAFTLVFVHIVLTTGGLQSDYFFLLYFLIFALSLMLEPIISVTTTLAIVLLFFITGPFEESLIHIIPLLSLPLLTPFALMLGNQYKKEQLVEKKLASEESDSNLFIFLIVKGHLKTIEDALRNFNGDDELATIKRTVKRLHKLIDDYESSH